MLNLRVLWAQARAICSEGLFFLLTLYRCGKKATAHYVQCTLRDLFLWLCKSHGFYIFASVRVFAVCMK